MITCLYFRASVDVDKKSCVQISLRNVADKLFLRDLHTTFLSEHFEACIKAGTSLHGIGDIRKGDVWQVTKRG